MSQYSYRIAARTEAAGKYNPSAPREGNEDSLAIIPDVGNLGASLSTDTVLPLPEKGTLMVVADGMGGHNAGEVASQIAVETVREMFSADKISNKQFDTPKSRANYLEAVVIAADKNIRADANANPERQGMGSTIVMVWIVGNELTVTWCGDSRAYRYHPGGRLEMLSEDHSLVQDMVRQKRISYEDTFSHPQGNVITRCLGGGGKGKAEPESRQYMIETGDIVLLCSDGLSGVVFDYEKNRENGEPYSAENLQDILSRPKESLKDTLSCLFDAARRCDWYDNVTAILFELRTGDDANVESLHPATANTGEVKENADNPQDKKTKKKCSRFWYFILGFVLICVGFSLSLLIRPTYTVSNGQDSVLQTAPMVEPEEGCQARDSAQSTAATPITTITKKVKPLHKAEDATNVSTGKPETESQDTTTALTPSN